VERFGTTGVRLISELVHVFRVVRQPDTGIISRLSSVKRIGYNDLLDAALIGKFKQHISVTRLIERTPARQILPA
jgi:hypothetical protein